MPRAKWNDQTLKRYIREGRGQGELDQYRPWLTTQDYASNGRSSRIKGWKTGRIHYFLSDIETRYFYLLEFDGDTAIWDIREHYPTVDLEVTLGDCDIELNKYRDKESGTQFVFTTTFLLTLKDTDGKKRYIARNVKVAAELEKPKVLERFELTRRYFAEKQIDWGIVTEHDINVTRAKNIEWVHSAKNLDDDGGLSVKDVPRLKGILLGWLDGTRKSVRDVTNALDSQFNLEPGSGLLLLRHLIANKQVLVDMNTRIDLGKPAKEVIRGIAVIQSDGGVRNAVDG
ncbi:heteromeric transposase endonuclease subunit TnsA [Alicyclobacillus tolerans]|uniref:TnsA endonuclease N terminal n=1 Tax=Alicyclobacillus tolerans TaxID=90970 RepID=A0A1M6TSM6_9BACL|nr:heteromeric transposase endonuclease subunit TnsA [Alicyclobacillus montanus]SHK59919.1 TnsA endonuclease N terminal [Alicyclobacillus montanus]